MKNVIFVGLNPTKLSIPRKGGAWHRFCSWLDEMEMIDIVSFTNISSDPNWDGKSVDTAFFEASLGEYTKIVAWGPGVSKHLSRMGIDHFTLPHPSPLNRQTNNREYISGKLKECKDYILCM